MKSEPSNPKKEKHNHQWIIDESDYIHSEEVKTLTKTCNRLRQYGLKNRKFSQVRNWFMVELGLNSGLRVAEMVSLKCGNLLIDKASSSIFVVGKGNKKKGCMDKCKFQRNLSDIFKI